jgi:hypothetical protein
MLHHMRSESPKCPLAVLALYLESLVNVSNNNHQFTYLLTTYIQIQFYGYWVQTKQRYFISEVKNLLAPLLLSLNHEEVSSLPSTKSPTEK